MRIPRRSAAVVAVSLALTGASVAAAPKAEAAGCTVNQYVVKNNSYLFRYPDGYALKPKWVGDSVGGPNSNVMPIDYSTYYRIVYRGDHSLGFMPIRDLRYVGCS